MSKDTTGKREDPTKIRVSMSLAEKRRLMSPYTPKRTLWEPYTGPEPPWEYPEMRVGPYPNKKRGLGSYDSVIIFGESNYQSARGLYHLFRGEIEKPPPAFPELAEFGNLTEPVTAEMYRSQTKRTLIDRAEYSDTGRWDTRQHKDPEWSFMIAAPDLEIKDPGPIKGAAPLQITIEGEPGNGALEMKSKDKWVDFFDPEGLPPVEVQIQVQHQLCVMDLKWASVAALIGRKVYWVDYARDDEFIEEFLKPELKAFWARLWEGVPPEVDDHDSTKLALDQLHPNVSDVHETELTAGLAAILAEEWDQLVKIQKDAEKREKTIKNLVRVEIGENERAYTKDGTFRFSNPRIDEGAVKWTVEGERSEAEIVQLQAMGGVYSKGKKSYRRLGRLKEK